METHYDRAKHLHVLCLSYCTIFQENLEISFGAESELVEMRVRKVDHDKPKAEFD